MLDKEMLNEEVQHDAEEMHLEDQETENLNESEYNETQLAAIDKGWKPLEQYLEEGGDPDKWRGAGAFMDFHDRQQKNNHEVKELKESLRKLTEGFEKLTMAQQEKYKKELEAARAEAVENSDFKAYDEANEQLNAIKESERPPQQQGEHPTIVSFRQENPLLDKESSEFNAEFDELVTFYVNKEAMSRGQRMDESQIQEVLDLGMQKAKRAMPDLFKRQTKTPPRTKSPNKQVSVDPVAKLDSDAKEMYDIIKSTQGDEAAANFAKMMAE